jgi:hypothetical protein
MTGVTTHRDATHYLANARIALSTIYHRPKLAGKGHPGPPQNSGAKQRKITK